MQNFADNHLHPNRVSRSALTWFAQSVSARRQFNVLPRVVIDLGFLVCDYMRLNPRSSSKEGSYWNKAMRRLGYPFKIRFKFFYRASTKETPYTVQTCDNGRFIIPDRYIEELENLPHTQISFVAELFDRSVGRYTKGIWTQPIYLAL